MLPLAIVKAFEHFKLSDKEIRVLDALFNKGRCTVGDMSTDPDVLNRSDAYKNVTRLVNKGAVNETMINNVHYYDVKCQKNFIRWMNKKRIQAEEELETINNHIGSVKSYLDVMKDYIPETKPQFHHYIGKRALSMGIANIPAGASFYVSIQCPTVSVFDTKLIDILKEKVIKEAGEFLCIADIDDTEQIRKLRQIPQLFLCEGKMREKDHISFIGSTFILEYTIKNGEVRGFFTNYQDSYHTELNRKHFKNRWQELRK